MIDVLHLLEKLQITKNIDEWDKLREIRNVITHEYPFDIEERIENIILTINGYNILLTLFENIKGYVKEKSSKTL